jgi:hypothetical protein
MIPASSRFDQSTLASLLEVDDVVADARAFFSLFDWSIVERWETQHSPRGRPAHLEAAYLKAFLIRIREGARLHHPTARLSRKASFARDRTRLSSCA